MLSPITHTGAIHASLGAVEEMSSPWRQRFKRLLLWLTAAGVAWQAGRLLFHYEAAQKEAEARFQRCCARAEQQLFLLLPRLLEQCDVRRKFNALKEITERAEKRRQWEEVKLDTFVSILLAGYSLAYLQATTLISHVLRQSVLVPSFVSDNGPMFSLSPSSSALMIAAAESEGLALLEEDYFLTEGIEALRFGILASNSADINALELEGYLTSAQLLALFLEARRRFEDSFPNLNAHKLFVRPPGIGGDVGTHQLSEEMQDILEHSNFQALVRLVADCIFVDLDRQVEEAFRQARQTQRAPGSKCCVQGTDTSDVVEVPAKALACLLSQLAFVVPRVLDCPFGAPATRFPPALHHFAANLRH